MRNSCWSVYHCDDRLCITKKGLSVSKCIVIFYLLYNTVFRRYGTNLYLGFQVPEIKRKLYGSIFTAVNVSVADHSDEEFAKSVPYEITESGKIDGAGDFKIFVSLIFPMLKPALATVGLFLALGYWNEWYLSSLYLNSSVTYKPLQYYLYQIINTANALKNSVAGANVSVADLPSNTLKMATAVVATGPIIFLYPFVQKYFISGITVGAVKG